MVRIQSLKIKFSQNNMEYSRVLLIRSSIIQVYSLIRMQFDSIIQSIHWSVQRNERVWNCENMWFLLYKTTRMRNHLAYKTTREYPSWWLLSIIINRSYNTSWITVWRILGLDVGFLSFSTRDGFLSPQHSEHPSWEWCVEAAGVRDMSRMEIHTKCIISDDTSLKCMNQ